MVLMIATRNDQIVKALLMEFIKPLMNPLPFPPSIDTNYLAALLIEI